MRRSYRWFPLSTVCCAVLGACSGGESAGHTPDAGTVTATGGQGTSTGGATFAGTGGATQPASTGGSPVLPASGGATGSGGFQVGPMNTGGRSTGGRSAGGTVGSSGGAGSGGRGTSTGGSNASGGSPVDSGLLPPAFDAGGGTDVNQTGLPAITLHLAGDSTVMTYAQPTATADEGWGQELGQYFISKVSINNQAIGGASVASFHTGRWSNITGSLKAGDYVMAAFGANDSGSVAGRHVDTPAFQMLFVQMADEVKAKQATFIPVTPSALREWTGTMEGNTRLGPYAAATIAAGMAKGLLVDDLNARSVEFLNMIGPTGAMQYYKGVDKAHFTKMGATQMAQFVAEELRRIGSPLAEYLK